MTDTKDTEHGKIAYTFVQMLAVGDYASAYQLLNSELKDEYLPSALKEQYEFMSNGGHTNLIQVMDNNMHDGNAAAMDAAGWVYVAVTGDDWNEAITVTVHNNLLSTLEWGRP